MYLSVQWVKCGNNTCWCPFETVDLSGVYTEGVYMIWHSGDPARVVRVGKGAIANRLGEHQNDPEILYYRKFGALYVTWAAVSPQHQDGVESYLADYWKPLVGERFPIALPVEVNSPWEGARRVSQW